MRGLVCAAAVLATAGAGRAQFTPGGVVVLRVDGRAEFGAASPLADRATPGFLDQFSSTAANQSVPTASVALPTATAGGVNRVLFTGSSSLTQLSRSGDGRSLVVAGYDLAPGTAAPAATLANRVIATASAGGTVRTPVLTSAYTAPGGSAAIRGAATVDGSRFWAAGSTGGTVTFTPSAAVQAGTVVQSTHASTLGVTVTALGTVRYTVPVTGAGTAVYGLFSSPPGDGTGPTGPTTPVQGFQAPEGQSNPVAFATPDGNTFYIADSRQANSNGGVQRWDRVAGGDPTFVRTRIIQFGTGADGGATSLAADFSDPNNPLFFATTAEAEQNRLVRFTETAAGFSAFTVLATAADNTVFRGAALAPVPEPRLVGAVAVAELVVARTRRRVAPL